MANQGGQGPPVTTIPPFTNTKILPACAASCVPLYDANGACVPPAVDEAVGAEAFTACFCANPNVAALSTATTGVCDDVCSGAGLSSVAGWFRDICSVDANAGNGGNGGNKGNGQDSSTATTTATTTTGSSATGGSSSGSNSGGGGDWISNHWQWVIMLVILVVGIAAIWVGACLWRRRYLRRKDRQSSLGQKHSGSASRPSWGPGMEASETGANMPYDPAAADSNRNSAGVFMPGAAVAATTTEKPPKKEKKRWIVRDRT
ncbi:hypothetical protein ACJ41O_007702 [Fusarium nematophilum]